MRSALTLRVVWALAGLTVVRPYSAFKPRGLTAAELDALAGRDGFCVVHDWLPAADVAAVRADALALDQLGLARQAGVGAGTARVRDESVRRSRMCSLRPPPPPASGSIDVRLALCDALEGLRTALDAAPQLAHVEPLTRFHTEVAYLLYPAGGFYERHLDTPRPAGGWLRVGRAPEDGSSLLRGQTRERRTLSLLLYLNPAWDAASWGGQLRVFLDDDEYQDVSPTAGTLVLMRSDRVEHEVLPTVEPRQCVVGWYRTVECDDGRHA